MKKSAQKVIVYSLAGLLQLGAGASVAQAASRDHHDGNPRSSHSDGRPGEERHDASFDNRHAGDMHREEQRRQEWHHHDWERMERFRREPPRYGWHWKEREAWERHEREEWQRLEYERHAWEMRRRAWESDREWHDRQWLEQQRHEHRMQEIETEIAAAVVRIFLHR